MGSLRRLHHCAPDLADAFEGYSLRAGGNTAVSGACQTEESKPEYSRLSLSVFMAGSRSCVDTSI